jgi:hypothetical protein
MNKKLEESCLLAIAAVTGTATIGTTIFSGESVLDSVAPQMAPNLHNNNLPQVVLVDFTSGAALVVIWLMASKFGITNRRADKQLKMIVKRQVELDNFPRLAYDKEAAPTLKGRQEPQIFPAAKPA